MTLQRSLFILILAVSLAGADTIREALVNLCDPAKVARELWKRHKDEPVYWNDLAWAVRRSEGLQKACQILLEAAKKFPEDAMTNYNLGCYHCQLGELEQAKEFVGQAIKRDGKFKILALDDSDLQPLWKDWEI